jgi:hypothetical protein
MNFIDTLLNPDRDEFPNRTMAVNGANCPSSKHLGHMILFHMGGPGSSRFDVKPLVVDGSSGALGWSVS